MDRETLVRILTHAPGISGKEPRFDVVEDHRLRLYIGRPGRAMEVTDIRSVTVERDFVTVDAGDEGMLYVANDDVHAISVRPSAPKSDRRAGFS